jgi:hypothetical protein
MKVHSYIKAMHQRSRTCRGPLKSTAEATGLSLAAVKRIKAESKKGGVFSTLTKHY